MCGQLRMLCSGRNAFLSCRHPPLTTTSAAKQPVSRALACLQYDKCDSSCVCVARAVHAQIRVQSHWTNGLECNGREGGPQTGKHKTYDGGGEGAGATRNLSTALAQNNTNNTKHNNARHDKRTRQRQRQSRPGRRTRRCGER